MANPYKGQVTVELGGHSFVLRYDMNAIAELEQALGVGFMNLFSEERMGIRLIRQCLYEGIRSSSRKITLDQVGSWMKFEEFESYVNAIGKAFGLATGQQFDDGTKPKEEENESLPLEVETVLLDEPQRATA